MPSSPRHAVVLAAWAGSLAALTAQAAAAPGAPRFASFPPDTLTVRPPAVPLTVHDPMLSQWLPADNGGDSYTVHWTIVFGGNGYKAMSALVRVDNATYRLLGPECPPGLTPALPQLGPARVYPLSTLFRFEGAGVSVNLTFTTPMEDGVARGLLLPYSYVVFDVASADGAAHEVSFYFDATAQLAVDVDTQNVTWSRVNLTGPGNVGMRTGTTSQVPFDGFGDDFRIDWGFLHLAAAATAPAGPGPRAGPLGPLSPPLTAMASSNLMRYHFVANGTLPPDEVYTNIPACTNPTTKQAICSCIVPGETGPANDWPALGVVLPAGTVSPADGVVTRCAVLAYDDVYSARFFGVDQVAWWRSLGRTVEELVDYALGSFDVLMGQSVARDLAVVTELRAAGIGEAYERMASLAYRQAFADNKLAYYAGEFSGPTPPGAHLWVKGAASSGDTGTLDDNFPAVPLFLWTYPELVPAFLTPLFMWGRNETYAGPDAPFPRNMTYDYPFAPHYLGQNPDAELQCWAGGNECEPMPIEMSGDALLITAAHAQQTGDLGFFEAYFAQFQGWAAYLAANGLYPGSQRSSDDYEGFIVNSTHLAAKAVLGLGAFSQLCAATGRAALAAEYRAAAEAMRDTWMQEAVDPGTGVSMLTYNQPGSWSVKYSLLFDRALQLGLFPQGLVDAECAFQSNRSEPYGWVLQRPAQGGNTWTNLGWLGFFAALCDDATASALYAQLVAYVGATDRRVALSDWYDASDAKFMGFTARAQVGGLFAHVWLRDIEARRARGELRGPWGKKGGGGSGGGRE